MRKISVLLVDDHTVVRQGLRALLSAEEDIEVVGEAENGRLAVMLARKSNPDVVVMDIQLPDISGIECTAKLKRLLPNTQIVMFTIQDDDEQVFQALQAGASGYLLKGSPSAEILGSLREVVRGGVPMTSEIARKVIRSFQRPVTIEGPAESLTAREIEVLEALVEGCISKEIAQRLSISIETVNYHLKQIYQKMHVRSRTEAVVKYLRR